MKIGVDARCLRGGPEAFAGVAIATWELLRAMLAEDSSIELVLYPGFKASGVWDPANDFDPSRVTVRWDLLPDRIRRHVPAWALRPTSARTAGIDVFLGPDFVLPELRGCPACIVMHDLSYCRYPDHVEPETLSRFRAQVPEAARRADLIMTPSEFTRSEVVELFAIHEDRVEAIPWGVASRFRRVRDPALLKEFLQRHDLTPGYVLAVGSLQPRKNLGRLLRAFLRLRGESPARPHLVLTGALAWKASDLIAEIEANAGAVVRLGRVPSQDLPALYSAAALLAFPSLYEGFGLPILEAMACGTPVLTSNRSSCPEVAGDAALCVDPEDEDAIHDALSQILNDRALRASLVERGLERAGAFSWEQAARRYLAVLGELRERAG